jgi:hypothetical protein
LNSSVKTAPQLFLVPLWKIRDRLPMQRTSGGHKGQVYPQDLI